MVRLLQITGFIAGLLLHLACNGDVRAQSGDSWTLPIHVKIEDFDFDLFIGVRSNATDGFDVGLDSLAPPPAFTPYVFLAISEFPNSLRADFRAPDSSITWRLQTFNSTNKIIEIFWDLEEFQAFGSLMLSDSIDMASQDSVVVVGDQSLEIVFSALPVSVENRDTTPLPKSFRIRNYPNPFSLTTNFLIEIPVSQPLVVRIFNILGQQIRAFNFHNSSAGTAEIQWDGTDDKGNELPSGVYVYRLEASGSVSVGMMHLVK